MKSLPSSVTAALKLYSISSCEQLHATLPIFAHLFCNRRACFFDHVSVTSRGGKDAASTLCTLDSLAPSCHHPVRS